MQHAWIDCADKPIYEVRFPGSGSTADLERWVAVVDEFYARNIRPFGWVVNLRSLVGAEPTHRKIIAEHHARHEKQLRELCFGFAYVVDDVVQRGVLTAFLWIAPPVYPHITCGERGAARRWLAQRRTAFAPSVDRLVG